MRTGTYIRAEVAEMITRRNDKGHLMSNHAIGGESFAFLDQPARVSVENLMGEDHYVWTATVFYIPKEIVTGDTYSIPDDTLLEIGEVYRFFPRDVVRLQMLGAGTL